LINLISRTLIERPVEQVFDFVSTPENDFQWQYGTLASARISEGASQRGTAFRSIGHLLGHRVQGTFEVTEYEPNKKYGFKSLSGPWQSHTSYTFEMDSGSTQLAISTQVTMINFHQVNQGALEKDMKKQLKENLVKLKHLLEAGQILPALVMNALAR
jgi:uncharacterized protein YndB with AHSA1/START domain